MTVSWGMFLTVTAFECYARTLFFIFPEKGSGKNARFPRDNPASNVDWNRDSGR